MANDPPRNSGHFPAGLFPDLLGLELQHVSGDRVLASMEVDQKHLQPFGVVHGGVYCSIVESVGSVGAFAAVRGTDAEAVAGVSNTTDFVRSHSNGKLLAEGTPIHQGRSQQLWEVNITRESDGKLVAHGQLRVHNVKDAGVLGTKS